MDSNYKNFIPDYWLADILQRDVYKIIIDDEFVKRFQDEKNMEYALWQNLCKKSVFLYVKVPVVSMVAIKFLSASGFYLVDTNVVFQKHVHSMPNKLVGNCNLRFAVPEDENQVVGLAKKAFKYSRFHLDNNFSTDIANTIKGEWAGNFFRGRRGEAMVIALVGKTIVGFLQLLNKCDGMLTIDLIAVDNIYQRRGIASDMIVYAETNCRDIKQIRVGTQVTNIPSLRLYEGLGFMAQETYYVFHYYNSQGSG